jgi:hypothetical protein
MRLWLALLLLAIVAFSAFFIGRLTATVVATAVTTASTTVPTTASATVPQTSNTNGLTAQQISTLNTNFRAGGCPRFDAAELQAALNQVPVGRLVFNLGNLAKVSPTQISQFILENKRRFPSFVEYCDGRRTATQFVQSLQGWTLNLAK